MHCAFEKLLARSHAQPALESLRFDYEDDYDDQGNLGSSAAP